MFSNPINLSSKDSCPHEVGLLLASTLLHDWGKDNTFLEAHMRLHPYVLAGMSLESRAHWATQNERTQSLLNSPKDMADAITRMRKQFSPKVDDPIPAWFEKFVSDPQNHRDILTIISHHDATSEEVNRLKTAGKISPGQSQAIRMLSAIETYEADFRVKLNEQFYQASTDAITFGEQWSRLYQGSYWQELHDHAVAVIRKRLLSKPDRYHLAAISLIDLAASDRGNWEAVRKRAYWFAHYAGVKPIGLPKPY